MRISEQRLQTISLLTLTVIGWGVVLHLLQNVFMPLVLGGFLALGLSPVVNFQARVLRFPVTLAVVTTLCLTLLLFWSGGLVVSASAEQLASSAAVYENQLIQLVHDVLGALPLERLHSSAEWVMAPLQHIPVGNIILDTRTVGVWFEIESRIKHYLVAKAIISLLVGLVIGLALALSGVRFALLSD
jgi:predicted PurR-regulated permease PerM